MPMPGLPRPGESPMRGLAGDSGGGQPLMIECGNEKKNGVIGVRGAERAREGVRGEVRERGEAQRAAVGELVSCYSVGVGGAVR